MNGFVFSVEEVCSAMRASRVMNWALYVRGLRSVHPPRMYPPVIVGDNYVVSIDAEPDPIANSHPGWDADGRETWDYPR